MGNDFTRSYCARELHRHDRDRYLACLFAPAARREALFALYAFNLEVAKTAEIVDEPMLGRIRLQWWREALEGIYADRPQRHEVILSLAAAVRSHGLGRAHFERLIDARELDLNPEPPEHLAQLEGYAEATSAGLVLLALEVLGAEGEAARAAGRHVGIAWALAGLLRAVPFHARQRRLYLPRDLSRTAGLAPEQLFALRAPPGLAEVAEQIAARAREHLAAARALRPRIAKSALPALLPAVLIRHYLGLLAKAGHDPFDSVFQATPPGNVWRLAWAALSRRY